MKAMRAIIWKELREHGKWALIAMVVIAGIAASVNMIPEQASQDTIPLDTAFYDGLLAWTTGAMYFAMGLGALQFNREWRKRDQWAFLIHRPISRAALFFSKAIAGLLIYLAGVGIPFVCELVWLSTPGHVAKPFTPSAALPGIVDIYAGVIVYFATIFMGMSVMPRNANFSMGGVSGVIRLIGEVVLLMCCSAIANTVPEYWQALVLLSALGALLVVAAYGSFAASGEYRQQRRLPRFCQATALYLGIVAGLWFLFVYLPQFSRMTMAPVGNSYDLDPNGRIVQLTWTNSKITGIRIADGKSTQNLNAMPWQMMKNLLSKSDIFDLYDDYSYRQSRHYFMRLRYHNDTAWYYSFASGRLNGYSVKNRHLIGSLGPDGFSRSASGSRFEETGWDLFGQGIMPGSNVFLMKDAHGAYEVAPDDYRVTRLASVDSSEHVRGVGSLDNSSNALTPQTPFATITDRYIRIATVGGRQLLTTPTAGALSVLPKPGDFSLVEVGTSSSTSHYFFIYQTNHYSSYRAPSLAPTGMIVETDAAGHELNRRAIPPLGVSLDDSYTRATWFSLLVPPAAITALAVAGRVFPASTFKEFSGQYAALPASWIMSLIAGIIAAALAYRIGRRHGWDKKGRIVWAFGVFWLGIPGLLMLVALQPFPVREICPACGRKRVITRQTCEHCGAAWPAPQRNGTEIFELEEAA